jgi:diguanylate cyclase (GGDEF)-like protein
MTGENGRVEPPGREPPAPDTGGGEGEAGAALDGERTFVDLDQRHSYTGLARTRAALRRDEAALVRDVSAMTRDRTSEARERTAERREASLSSTAGNDAAVAALRECGAMSRARAAADRARAAADRTRAADDRARAAEDRRHARIDLRRAYLDDLTGVYTRTLGLMTLEHEIERAHRAGQPFVLAFVDVDGLKQVNDERGHAAGDALLRAVAAEVRSKLRSYDLIVRVGGDEFICAFGNTTLEAAAQRVREISAGLEQAGVDGSISVGLAQLRPGETLEDLTARGDTELYRVKRAGDGLPPGRAARSSPPATAERSGEEPLLAELGDPLAHVTGNGGGRLVARGGDRGDELVD